MKWSLIALFLFFATVLGYGSFVANWLDKDSRIPFWLFVGAVFMAVLAICLAIFW